MTPVVRNGELFGLPSMIADLLDGNLRDDPARARLLSGKPADIRITATDLDSWVDIRLGDGQAVVSQGTIEGRPALWIKADSSTLLDLPNAKLLGGLPSIMDPIGRSVTMKMLKGELKIKGLSHLGLLTRLQRLLSVA